MMMTSVEVVLFAALWFLPPTTIAATIPAEQSGLRQTQEGKLAALEESPPA
jgi:hypothetical protein